MERLTNYYSGRVQGVGFRATCQEIASRFKVTGRVCNLSDGRVELIAEGEPNELTGFAQQIAERMQRLIVDTQSNWSQATKEWDSFKIDRDKFV